MAESKLRIVLEASDKATPTLKKFNQGLDTTATKTKGITEGFKDFTKILGASTAAIFTVAKGLDATIGAYVGYGQQVRELSTNLGISTEETSRLIQIADDFKISIEEVRTSLQLAAKNGFEPSIENLANLADELQGMEKATDRAARMSQIFGRNWAVLNPLLAEGGDAIRENAAAIQENLILTEESVAKTREWELALDEWEDRVQAAKIGIGSFLVEGLLPYFRIAEEMPAVTDVMNERLRDFDLRSRGAAGGGIALADAIRASNDALREGGEAAKSFDKAMLASQGLNTLTKQAEAAADANMALVSSFSEVTLASAAAGALEELNTALDTGLISQEDYEAAIRDIGTEFLNLSPAQLNMILEQSRLRGEAEKTTRAVWAEVAAWKALAHQLLVQPGSSPSQGRKFQHGGSFIVGGPPGVDRSLVAFNATRGERVDITPSGASKGGGRIQIGPNYITSDSDEQAFAERMKISLRRLL